MDSQSSDSIVILFKIMASLAQIRGDETKKVSGKAKKHLPLVKECVNLMAREIELSPELSVLAVEYQLVPQC